MVKKETRKEEKERINGGRERREKRNGAREEGKKEREKGRERYI